MVRLGKELRMELGTHVKWVFSELYNFNKTFVGGDRGDD